MQLQKLHNFNTCHGSNSQVWSLHKSRLGHLLSYGFGARKQNFWQVFLQGAEYCCITAEALHIDIHKKNTD